MDMELCMKKAEKFPTQGRTQKHKEASLPENNENTRGNQGAPLGTRSPSTNFRLYGLSVISLRSIPAFIRFLQ